MDSEDDNNTERVVTGVPGLDDVLGGGYLPESAILVRGPPGSGKSILTLHFLAAGIGNDETVLHINLGEPAAYIQQTAEGFGIDTTRIEFLNLSPTGEKFQSDESYTLFRADEVETPSMVQNMRAKIQEINPDRVVIDPVTEFRYLASDDRQFRSHVLGLLDLLKGEGATILLTSQAAASMPDDDLQFLADAVLELTYDQDRRTIQAPKFRGSSVHRGPHTLEISDHGMRVWPRLDPISHSREFSSTRLSSGVAELDDLLSGGLSTGTMTFLSGPTGVGKTTTGLQFLAHAAKRGQRSVFYSFEETRRTLFDRAAAIGSPLSDLVDRGTLNVEIIGPNELSIDEFTHHVRTEVEENGAELVMIDGTEGFVRSLRGLGADPLNHLVTIGHYLRNMGVTGIVSNEVSNVTGEFRATDQGMSHLADNIIILRHVEYRGSLRKVIGVLKMRSSDFENQLRELEITDNGLVVGEPLSGLRGILTGTPSWESEGE